jgi:hypothetical protein
MAQASWPSPTHNSRNVTDAEYERIAARFSDDGVYGDPDDSAVVSPGVGLSVDILADVYGSVRGHAWHSGTTGDTLAISSNSSGSTRVDWVVLRLDRSDWTVRAAVREGTPGSGAPALVQDDGDTGMYEIPLAKATTPSGATTVTVTRAEQYVGTRVRPCTSDQRPMAPRRGEAAYELDTGRLILWNGTVWNVVYSNSGVIVVNQSLTSWSIETDSVIEERNGNVHLRLGTFQRTASGFSGTTDSRLPVLIPDAYRHANRDRFVIGYVSGLQICRLTIYAKTGARPGQVWLTQHPAIAKGDAILTSSASWVVN